MMNNESESESVNNGDVNDVPCVRKPIRRLSVAKPRYNRKKAFAKLRLQKRTTKVCRTDNKKKKIWQKVSNSNPNNNCTMLNDEVIKNSDRVVEIDNIMHALKNCDDNQETENIITKKSTEINENDKAKKCQMYAIKRIKFNEKTQKETITESNESDKAKFVEMHTQKNINSKDIIQNIKIERKKEMNANNKGKQSEMHASKNHDCKKISQNDKITKSSAIDKAKIIEMHTVQNINDNEISGNIKTERKSENNDNNNAKLFESHASKNHDCNQISQKEKITKCNENNKAKIVEMFSLKNIDSNEKIENIIIETNAENNHEIKDLLHACDIITKDCRTINANELTENNDNHCVPVHVSINDDNDELVRKMEIMTLINVNKQLKTSANILKRRCERLHFENNEVMKKIKNCDNNENIELPILIDNRERNSELDESSEGIYQDIEMSLGNGRDKIDDSENLPDVIVETKKCYPKIESVNADNRSIINTLYFMNEMQRIYSREAHKPFDCAADDMKFIGQKNDGVTLEMYL